MFKITPLKSSKAGKSEITPVNTQEFVHISMTHCQVSLQPLKLYQLLP